MIRFEILMNPRQQFEGNEEGTTFKSNHGTHENSFFPSLIQVFFLLIE
jgi:hypothetical protein